MLIALVSMNANAAMYLVGNEPLGEGWDPSKGIEMTDNGDSTYTYDVIINGEVWFCFAEALANNWDDFNGQYRYGPTGGTNQTVTAGEWITTQKQGNGNGSYYFRGSGDKYTVTFSLKALQFKIDGYVEPITEDTYTVAGGNAAIFGTAWAPGEAANDMTLDPADGLYKLAKDSIEIEGGYTLEYKVCKNHGWGTNWGATPNGDNQTYTFNESGTYNLTFTFDLENEVVDLIAEKVQEGPIVDPITGDFFILGQVNDNNWNPSTGIQMATIDEDVYTLNDATFTDGGDGYAYFSFTSKLGADENDWSFAAYRRGAVEDGTLVEDGVNAVLADWGSGNNAFKVLPGIYDVEVSLSSDYVKLTKKGDIEPVHYDGDVYIMGEVNDNGGWFTNKGVLMAYDAESNVYTATITTAGENIPEGEEVGYSYFSFTKQLAETEADWDAIAPYRFGAADSEGDYWVTDEVLGTEIRLANGGPSFCVPAGKWNVTVSVDNMIMVIEAVAAEVIRGDANNDGTVSIADVSALIDYLLSKDPTSINMDNADCNQDQNITIADVSALIDYLLAKTW